MFKIIENKNGTFCFNLFARNGEKILTGEDYTTKAGVENNIELVKKYSFYDENFEKKATKFGKYYFVLKANNGRVIGESKEYLTEASRDNVIELVKKYTQ